MIWKAIILLSLALCVLGDGHAVSEQHFRINHEHRGHHGELGHIGSREPEHHEEYARSYPSYEFSYSVHDPHTHDNKGQHETRHGDEVRGEYWLMQPDGRKRTVKYHADKHSGFQATVHYSDDHHHVTEHHGHHERRGSGSSSSSSESGSSSSESGSSSSSSESGSSSGSGSSSSSSESGSDERSGEETRGPKGTVVAWNPSKLIPFSAQPSRINPRFQKPEPLKKIAKPN